MSDGVRLLPNIALVACAEYDGKAWTDPWGNLTDGYVVRHIEWDLMDTGRRFERDVGYGPDNMATDRIWLTSTGAFMRQFTNPIDYHGGSVFRYCDDLGDPFEAAGRRMSFEQPVGKRRYIMDGSPWIPDLARPPKESSRP